MACEHCDAKDQRIETLETVLDMMRAMASTALGPTTGLPVSGEQSFTNVGADRVVGE